MGKLTATDNLVMLWMTLTDSAACPFLPRPCTVTLPLRTQAHRQHDYAHRHYGAPRHPDYDQAPHAYPHPPWYGQPGPPHGYHPWVGPKYPTYSAPGPHSRDYHQGPGGYYSPQPRDYDAPPGYNHPNNPYDGPYQLYNRPEEGEHVGKWRATGRYIGRVLFVVYEHHLIKQSSLR